MAEREKLVAWITKFALTSGIIRKDVELCSDITSDESMISVIGGRNECYFGNDWHRTEADAIKRAQAMQKAKLISMDKQRGRIEKLKFEPEKRSE